MRVQGIRAPIAHRSRRCVRRRIILQVPGCHSKIVRPRGRTLWRHRRYRRAPADGAFADSLVMVLLQLLLTMLGAARRRYRAIADRYLVRRTAEERSAIGGAGGKVRRRRPRRLDDDATLGTGYDRFSVRRCLLRGQWQRCSSTEFDEPQLVPQLAFSLLFIHVFVQIMQHVVQDQVVTVLVFRLERNVEQIFSYTAVSYLLFRLKFSFLKREEEKYVAMLNNIKELVYW